MHHNATGCSCINELIEILKRANDYLKMLTILRDSDDARGMYLHKFLNFFAKKPHYSNLFKFSDERTMTRVVQRIVNIRPTCIKLLELLNSFNPPELRKYSIGKIKKVWILTLQLQNCCNFLHRMPEKTAALLW